MEESGSGVKVPVEKLVSYDREWCQAGFGGSGNNGDIIDSVIEQVIEALDDKQYDDLHRTRVLIRGKLESIYKDQRAISLHPDDYTGKKVELLVAVRPKRQQEVVLLKANGPVLKTVQTQEVIGAGDIIRYVAEGLFRDKMPISQAILLGTHLVSLAKKHVPGCGGPTRALIVTSDGRVGWERPEDLDRQERFLEQFNESIKELTLICADTSVPNNEVSQKLETAFENLKQLRERYFDDVYQSNLIRAMTDPEGYQGEVYPKFLTGTTHYMGPEAFAVYQRLNEENHERAQREHKAEERASEGSREPESNSE